MILNYHNALIAEAYYMAMKEKNVAEMGKHLHPDVRLITPLQNPQERMPLLVLLRIYVLFLILLPSEQNLIQKVKLC